VGETRKDHSAGTLHYRFASAVRISFRVSSQPLCLRGLRRLPTFGWRRCDSGGASKSKVCPGGGVIVARNLQLQAGSVGAFGWAERSQVSIRRCLERWRSCSSVMRSGQSEAHERGSSFIPRRCRKLFATLETRKSSSLTMFSWEKPRKGRHASANYFGEMTWIGRKRVGRHQGESSYSILRCPDTPRQ
jgi:hypothetical protein